MFSLDLVGAVALSISASAPQTRPQSPAVLARDDVGVQQSFIDPAEACVEESVDEVPTLLVAANLVPVEDKALLVQLVVRENGLLCQVGLEVLGEVVVVGEIEVVLLQELVQG